MKKWLFPLHSQMQSSFICSSGKAPKCVAMLCDGHESWPSKWVACAAVYSVNICMYVKYKVYILCIGEIKWPTIFELCVIAVWSSLLFSKECILDILLLPCNTHMLYKKKKAISWNKLQEMFIFARWTTGSTTQSNNNWSAVHSIHYLYLNS